ncbi:MAG: hypothetical protein ACPGU9_02575 [Flavobacteriaceae bacterium]
MSKHKSTEFSLSTIKQISTVLVKITLVCAALLFIYRKLTQNGVQDIENLYHHITKHRIITVKNIVLLLCFSGLNWFLESLKWQYLTTQITRISLLEATEQSLGALTASIITPNRIGEYGAKAIYYKKSLRKKIVGLNFIGNLSQLICTLLFGCIGLTYVIYAYKLPVSYINLLSVVSVLLVCVIFYTQYLSKTDFSIKGYSFKKLNQFVTSLKFKTLVVSFTLSLLRYLCFSNQFYILIWLLGVEIDYIDAMAFISSMYILASIIPTVFIFDVAIKSSIAVWLFSFSNANELTIIACTTLMWILNFALPALLGSYSVLNFKFPEEE